jgi:hypothetical protein
LGLGAAHGSQIGEIGSCGAPAHIESACGDITEVNTLHQDVRVHHHGALAREQGGIITELLGRSEGTQPVDQIPLS